MITLTSIIVLVSSDFHKRVVSLWVLLIFGCFMILNALLNQHPIFVLWNVVSNCVVLAMLWLSFMLYSVVRRYAIKGAIQKFIGVGDILFLIFLTPIFEPNRFVCFLIVGFSLSIIYWLLSHKATIPLVGTLGIELNIYLFSYAEQWQIY